VLFLLSACTPQPVFANIRTAKDSGGEQVSAEFSQNETVYVIFDFSNANAGDIVSAKWYADNVSGIAPGYFLGDTKMQIPQPGPYALNFEFAPPSIGWLAGTYKVDLYLNNVSVDSISFAVH
jgi:hypothetical protein